MSVLTVPQAKDHLNLTVSTNDAEVQAFIDAVESAIAKRVGPLTSTATTVRVRPVGCRMALPVLPAISLTSVTPANAAALTLGDLYLDTRSGVVTFNSGAEFIARYYDVVYNAGRASLPGHLLLADKEMLGYCWAQSQLGRPARPNVPSPEMVMSGLSFVDHLLKLDPYYSGSA